LFDGCDFDPPRMSLIGSPRASSQQSSHHINHSQGSLHHPPEIQALRPEIDQQTDTDARSFKIVVRLSQMNILQFYGRLEFNLNY